MQDFARSTLILGFDPRTALAVSRSLHRAKITVVVGLIAEWESPLRSRSIRHFVKLPGPERGPEKFLTALRQTMMRFSIDTIIPVTDRALVCLQAHDEELRKEIKLASPTPTQTAAILDKLKAQTLAEELGIPIPVTRLLSDCSEPEGVLEPLKFPVFLKLRDKTEIQRKSALPIQDGRLCKNLVELGRYSDCCDDPENILVQENIPGDDVGLAFIIQGGRGLCTFQYRARKLYPAEGGVCVLAETEAVHPAMAEAGRQILRKLNWEGVAQLDFRHDKQTGRFTFLEVNGRHWGSVAAAICAGLDFPLYSWQVVHGIEPVIPNYCTGRLVRWLEGDIRRLIAVAKDPNTRKSFLLREILKFFAGFHPAVRGMSWSWRDPIAGYDLIYALTCSWLASRMHRRKNSKPIPLPALSNARITRR